MQDDRIQLHLRSLKINRPLLLKTQSVVTVSMLYDIMETCLLLQNPPIFQALYTFLLFSFLRFSNVLPHTMHSFDPSYQRCSGDVIVSENGATILIKWSKTNQQRQQLNSIAIPELGESSICPVRALKL